MRLITIALTAATVTVAAINSAAAGATPLTQAEEVGIINSCQNGIEPIPVISDLGQPTGQMIMPIFDNYGEPVAAIPVSGPVLAALKGCDTDAVTQRRIEDATDHTPNAYAAISDTTAMAQ